MAVSTDDNGDRVIEIVRTIKAPPDRVFGAFTDSEHISHWWGPHGFTTTTKRMDVRPGGEWRFIMHGPDGTNYQNLVRYSVVERPTRLVYDHSEPDGPMTPFHVTVTFDEVAGGTRVTFVMLCASAEVRAHMAKFGAIEGGHNTLHRLDMRLARADAAAKAKPFMLIRTFDAPRDQVWSAWTEPERLAEWWGPKGSKIDILDFDFREGGIFHYAMTYSTGAAMCGRFLYREIIQPQRLVWFNSFATDRGAVMRAPFNANWPLEVENHLNISEQGDKTVLALTVRPVGPTDDEMAIFEGMFASLEQGYGGTMDQLAAHLAKGGA